MSAHLLGDMSSLLFEVPRRCNSSPLGPFGGTPKAITSAVLTSEELPSARPLSPKSNTDLQIEHPPFSRCDCH